MTSCLCQSKVSLYYIIIAMYCIIMHQFRWWGLKHLPNRGYRSPHFLAGFLTYTFSQCWYFRFLSYPPPLAASRCGTFCPDHHAWARERRGLHHTLHGLFCGRSAAQGRTHCGHVCLPGTLRPVTVGLHCGHRAPCWHPSVLAQLAQPTPATHGIRVIDNTVQFHVVRVWLICTTR